MKNAKPISMNKYKRLYIRFLKENTTFSYQKYGGVIKDILVTDNVMPTTYHFPSLKLRNKFLTNIQPILKSDLMLNLKGYDVYRSRTYLRLDSLIKDGKLYNGIKKIVEELEYNYYKSNKLYNILIDKLFNAND